MLHKPYPKENGGPAWTINMPKRARVVFAHCAEWTSDEHYGMCGQSCPCCRFDVETRISPDPASWIGVCDVCLANSQQPPKRMRVK